MPRMAEPKAWITGSREKDKHSIYKEYRGHRSSGAETGGSTKSVKLRLKSKRDAAKRSYSAFVPLRCAVPSCARAQGAHSCAPVRRMRRAPLGRRRKVSGVQRVQTHALVGAAAPRKEGLQGSSYAVSSTERRLLGSSQQMRPEGSKERLVTNTIFSSSAPVSVVKCN